jgi:hypothetical protein
MAVIREHLASKGLGLHCDLQNEHMIVGNNVGLLLMLEYGSPAQQAEWVDNLAAGRRGFAFGITEPAHGSDATYMETTAVRDGDDWIITGEKTFNTGVHAASHDLVFARTSGQPGAAEGITAFLTPVGSPGFTIEDYLWTFNMPTDHAHERRSSAGRAAVCRLCSTSSTRTGSGRPHPAWARRSTASTSQSPMPCSASRSESRSRLIRRFSSRLWNSRHSARCYARSSTRPRG